MPFFLIPSTLGVCFFLIWVFIGGMMFRDGQLAAQQEREFDGAMPRGMHRVDGPSSIRRARAKRMRGKTAGVGA